MHRRIVFSATIIVGLMVGLLLASCGGPKIDAEALYTSTCVACHGPDREGLPGLGLPLTPESLASRSKSEIRDIINNGVPDTAMQSFEASLDADEIDALIDFIKNTAP